MHTSDYLVDMFIEVWVIDIPGTCSLHITGHYGWDGGHLLIIYFPL